MDDTRSVGRTLAANDDPSETDPVADRRYVLKSSAPRDVEAVADESPVGADHDSVAGETTTAAQPVEPTPTAPASAPQAAEPPAADAPTVTVSVPDEVITPAADLSPDPDESNPMLLLGVLAWARRHQSTATPTAAQASRQASSAVATANGIPMAARSLASAVPSGDSTTYLQSLFDALRPGETLTLGGGVYRHSGNLFIRTADVTIDGGGAIFEATNPATSAVAILADGVTFTNVHITQPVGLARVDNPYRAGLVVGNKGVTVRNVSVTGGSSVGIFVIGASNFLLDNVVVQDTASDGIQMYAGANNGVVKNARVLRAGDDGIAVVSYMGDPISRNIEIISPYVYGTHQTRGLVVSGGENITFKDITVENTALSGVFVGSQVGTLSTQSVRNIVVDGGTIRNANTSLGYATGAVTVYNDNWRAAVRDVQIKNLTIIETPMAARSNILHYSTFLASLRNVSYTNLAVEGSSALPVILANSSYGYTLSGITVNNSTVTTRKTFSSSPFATPAASCGFISRLLGRCSSGAAVPSAVRVVLGLRL